MADKSKFDMLLEAALTGDKSAVDKALKAADFNIFELMALPRQFDTLPIALKQDLAAVYRDHPDVLPPEAQPLVEKALTGITPTAAKAPPIPPQTVPPDITMPRLRQPLDVAAAYYAGAGQQTTSIPVALRNAIADQTSTEGMTPRAMSYLEAARSAAADAGLARIDIVAGKGGGHLSHAEGTEWDIIGYNADGSMWTNAQRVAVAGGARDAGADRFGLYEMDKGLGAGTLHIGYSGNGRPAAVWGANGLTSGAAAQNFKDPDSKAFFAAYSADKPYKSPTSALAYAPTQRPSAAAATTAAIAPKPSPLTDVSKPHLRPADIDKAAEGIVDRGKVMAKGASGDDVREIQRFLNQQGITDDKGKPLEEDGEFGIRTRQAVKNFQETHPELVVDGIIGPRTVAAIIQDAGDLRSRAAGQFELRGGDGTRAEALVSLGVTDPITDAKRQAELAQAGAAGEAAAQKAPRSDYVPQTRAAENAGIRLAQQASSPTGGAQQRAAESAPEILMGGTVSGPAQAERPSRYNAAVMSVSNELTLPHMAPADAYRSGGGQLGEKTNALTSDIVYAATNGYAKHLLYGTPLSPEEDTSSPITVAESPLPNASEVPGHGTSAPHDDSSGNDPQPPPIDWNPPNDPGPVYHPPDEPPPDPTDPVWL